MSSEFYTEIISSFEAMNQSLCMLGKDMQVLKKENEELKIKNKNLSNSITDLLTE